MNVDNLKVNQGKNCLREVDGQQYERYAIQTDMITKDDRLLDVVNKFALAHLKPGDILFMSEKAVACTQNRAIPLEEIKPRPLARLLCKFVYKSPHGIGLALPETMEMALRECGTPRILFAAFCSAVGKLFHKRGVFYRVAGEKARSIDGPTAGTIPPLDRCVVLGPKDPMKVASDLSQAIGHDVLIIDANDLGINILGWSNKKMNIPQMCLVLSDNPLGQSTERTPMGLIRKVQR